MSDLRIGISMRETNALNYFERRDSISRDWFSFLKKYFPNANYILLPNVGNDIIDYIKKWNLNAFILSGGDDYGIYPRRDITEKNIFEFSRTNSLPIFGVCRGAQIIYKFMGGLIEKGDEKIIRIHSSNRHKIRFKNLLYSVNSYHSSYLIEETKPSNLNITSKCLDDGLIESFEGCNILGFMWHPERENNINKFEIEEIKKLFRYE